MRRKTCITYSQTPLVLTLSVALLATGCATPPASASAQAPRRRSGPTLSAADDALLEDLSKRSFMFFWEHADPADRHRPRSRAHHGAPVEPTRATSAASRRSVSASAACASPPSAAGCRGRRRSSARGRRCASSRTRMPHERGWFFHFVNIRTGAREWNSELSSIDSALLARRRADRPPVFRRRMARSPAWPTRSTGASISPGCSPGIRSCCRTAGGPSRDSWRRGGITTAS